MIVFTSSASSNLYVTHEPETTLVFPSKSPHTQDGRQQAFGANISPHYVICLQRSYKYGKSRKALPRAFSRGTSLCEDLLLHDQRKSRDRYHLMDKPCPLESDICQVK